jgi:23S rRNA (cytosine1962-C5)-methyltransferase
LAETFPTVRVNRKAAGRVASGHPWIYSSDVVDRGTAQPGDVVRVVMEGPSAGSLSSRAKSRDLLLTPEGGPQGRASGRFIERRSARFLGVAHYSSASQITLRMLSANVEPADVAFFRARLAAAIAHRQHVVENSDACRLVYSEADLLPGLIVDRYGSYLTMQTLSQGMDRARDVIAHCLQDLLAPAGILARNDAGIRKLEGLELEVVTLAGEIPERVHVRMNGLDLEGDLLHGQKTGIYLDQRENYIAAARYLAAFPGRARVLDCFTSTGGFALHMARNAESVLALDSSALALAIAQSNARANGIANIDFRQADVFEFLAGVSANEGRRYSMVVLDPPAFAKSRKSLDDAARGYKEINLRALRLLDSGGVLATCSCSHHMSEAALLEIIAEAALDAGKTLRVLERRTQARDHPILLTVPETHYLKCLILQVV